MKVRRMMSWAGTALLLLCVRQVGAIVTENISRSEDDPASYAAYSDFDWDHVYSVGGSSGVAVHPNWVLTAAHVPSGNITRGSVTHTALESFTHSAADLRLIRYDIPFPGSYPIYTGTFPLPPPPIIDKLTGLMVGYGRTGDVLSDTTYNQHGGHTAGTKRWGDSLIDGTGDGMVFSGYTTDYIQLNFNRTATDYAAGGAANDSGGGVFVKDGGTWYLAGTMFVVLSNQAGDLVGVRAARLPEYEEWIMETIPEPATGMFFLLGGTVLLGLARFLRAA